MCEGQVSGPVSNKIPGGPERNPIGVFILEDQEIVRRGLRVLLEAEPDIQVIGEAGTASAALAQIPVLCPAVVVLDVRLPDGDGVSVCREVRSRAPGVACLMLTAFSDDEALLASVMAGAAGYVLKQIRGCDLVGAVRVVASGRSLLDPRATSKAMARLRDEADRHDPLAGLTARERSWSDQDCRRLPSPLASIMFMRRPPFRRSPRRRGCVIRRGAHGNPAARCNSATIPSSSRPAPSAASSQPSRAFLSPASSGTATWPSVARMTCPGRAGPPSGPWFSSSLQAFSTVFGLNASAADPPPGPWAAGHPA